MTPPRLEPVSSETIRPWRARYLAELPEAQEAFLEVLAQNSQPFLLHDRQRPLGYVLVHEGSVLIEFYLISEALSFAQDLFPSIVRQLGATRAWIKSFDHLFLSCALDCQSSLHTKGLLVREYLARALPKIERIAYTRRVAEPRDLGAIRAVDQQVFTHEGRLAAAIEAGAVHLFESHGKLVGFCLVRSIVPGQPHVDVGIAVDGPFRNKGYAPYMLRDIVELCWSLGLHPVTGCEQSNTASFRVGRRIGFVARYRLVEAMFDAESDKALTGR